MIYLICFILSSFFMFLSEKFKKNRYLKIFFSIFAVLTPSLLAGLRSINIGTDVKVYVVPAFNLAQEYTNFFDYNKIVSLEFLYKLLVFLVTNVFNNINYLLFVQHFIICSLFFIGAKQHSEKANPTITYTLFLLMYYNMSLNIVRQFLAMAFVFISFKYLEDGKFKKFIILVLTATLFHTSAIIALVFYFLYFLCKKKYRLFYSMILLIILIISLLYFNNILEFLTSVGIINSKYIRYKMIFEQGNISVFDSLIKIYIFGLTFFQFKKLKKDKENYFYTLISLFDLILLQIGIFSQHASRISLYFGMYSLINISRILKNSKENKLVLTMFTLVIFIIYFIYVYIYGGAAQTYPYEFYIQ